MRKKIFSILTSAVCIVSLLPSRFTNVSAYDVYESFSYKEWDSDGDGTKDSIHIISCSSEDEYIEIPEKINELPVNYIGNNMLETDGEKSFFVNSANVKSIKIPDSVIEIYADTFSGCTALENITLSKNLKSIETRAFYKCSSLTNIVIPDSVTSIATSAFAQCMALKQVNIPDNVTSVAYDAFKNTEIINSQTGVQYIDKWVISCETDTEISECIIKDGTVGIAGSAFYNCSGISSIIIPDSVKYLGILAFSQMQAIENIVIGNGIDSIPHNCFNKCTSLNNVTIPDSVRTIDSNAFSGCTALTNIILPDSIIDIGTRAFQGCTGIEKITLPNNLTELRDIFFGCNSLKTVVLPKSLTKIKQSAFYGCKSLENIDIPKSVICIEVNAFENTALLNNQTDKVKYIGDWLIKCDDSSTECTIKETTKGIAMQAFANCNEIKNIVIPNSVTLLNESAFKNCLSLETVIIGNGLEKIDNSAFSRCSSLENVIIPNNVTSLGNYVFNECFKLSSIKLPNSIKEIGKFAFNRCNSLESIVVPESCKIISSHAFAQCNSLDKLTILNPDCEICGDYGAISNKYDSELGHFIYYGTIYGYANSTAKTYAEKYNYKFSVLENIKTPVLYGDITGNGCVDTLDLDILQKYLVKKRTLKSDAFESADMNQDGKVNILDSILLKRKIMSTNIYLKSDKKELLTNEENTLTYFYADVYAENVTVKLYNALTDQPIMNMVDDGKYSVSGDDIINDGVYSCKLEIDNSEEKNFYYYAKIEESGEKSDFCTVKVFDGFTDQDIEDMKAVNDAISDLLSGNVFWQLSESEIKAKCDELFIKLLSEGLIIDVNYDEKTKTYKYTYKCEISGYVYINTRTDPIDSN